LALIAHFPSVSALDRFMLAGWRWLALDRFMLAGSKYRRAW